MSPSHQGPFQNMRILWETCDNQIFIVSKEISEIEVKIKERALKAASRWDISAKGCPWRPSGRTFYRQTGHFYFGLTENDKKDLLLFSNVI